VRDLLALHCALASGSAWRGVAAHLPGVRVIAPDLPGHGRRPPFAGRDLLAAALEVALEVLPDAPVHVVGHSFGACLALRLLVERPDRVLSLTLVEPVLFAAHPEARALYAETMAPCDAAMARGDREGAAAQFHGLWGAGAWEALPEPARAYIAGRIHIIGESASAIVDDAHGILPRLPADAAPVIVTRRDPPLQVARIAEGLVARMPRARRVELGRGHMIPMEEPAALAEVIRGEMEGEG
jgi:pimeloyl-ACP methyl ester carboxylesterase